MPTFRPAASLGAIARTVSGIVELEAALKVGRRETRTVVITIRTDPRASTDAGGAWWEVAVPEVSPRPEVAAARATHESQRRTQRQSN